MNPAIFKTLFFTFSFKQQLKIVFFTFLFVLTLPLLAVVVITQTGTQVVSDKLATVSVAGRLVEIRDPATGNIVKVLKLDSILPVSGVVTLEFGESDLPYQPLHTGVDIANSRGKTGDPIRSFLKGKVIYAGEISWGYGKHVIIDHGDNITSLYAHLDNIAVKKDQEVSPGEIIGTEGETGWATGPHLHFEVRVYGVPANPRVFIDKI